MSKNSLKKMYIFSNENIKEIVDKYVRLEAKRRDSSLSRVVEELLLDAIYRQVPESQEEISKIFENRYSFGYNKIKKEGDKSSE